MKETSCSRGSNEGTKVWQGGLGSLSRRPETADLVGALDQVLGAHAFHPFPPHLKALALQGSAHEGSDVVLFQPKLPFDGFERRAVFPGHLDDAIQVFGRPVFPWKGGPVHRLGGHRIAFVGCGVGLRCLRHAHETPMKGALFIDA